MLARVQIPLPFNILVEFNQQFVVPSQEKYGYKILLLPPLRDPTIASNREPTLFKMNEKDAMLCNTIIIHFFKSEFNRPLFQNKEKSEISDPSAELINEILNYFLLKLRWVTDAPKIHPIDVKRTGWRVDYYKDDMTPLSPDNKIHGDIKYAFEGNYPKINYEIWMETVYSTHVPGQRNWEDFVLDAYDVLPQVGLSIMLANIALEMFIPNILNQLAQKNGFPNIMWYKDPSIEDQYDTLLRILSGHSLKEENQLWEAFKNLRTARNNYVHEGIACIKNKQLTEKQTIELLQKMDMIFLKIREWLPEKMQWELPKKREFKIEFGIPVVNIKGKDKIE
ncbi:MAG: hypothetical protein WC552_08605 [Candidatus Omnitrophota bacterium]